MKITNNKIKNIKFIPSPKFGNKMIPDTIIIHYTASGSAKSAIRTLCDKKYKVSTHLVIDLDGTITQLVPFNVVAWHAGKSEYGGRTKFNNFSIGVEIVNSGKLDKNRKAWFGKIYPKSETEEVNNCLWHKYTGAQINALYNVCNLIKKKYSIHDILGHNEIAPKRKLDPGPLLNILALRNSVLNSKPKNNHLYFKDCSKFSLNISSSSTEPGIRGVIGIE